MITQKSLERIKRSVKKDYGPVIWPRHILVAVRYALKLARLLKADTRVVETAAVLHDIGKFRKLRGSHETSGAREARKILSKTECEKKFIDRVCECIRTHNGRHKPLSLEARIVMNADGLAHFDVIPALLWKMSRELGLMEFFAAAESRMAWERKKLTLKPAREMVRKKDSAFRTLFAVNRAVHENRKNA